MSKVQMQKKRTAFELRDLESSPRKEEDPVIRIHIPSNFCDTVPNVLPSSEVIPKRHVFNIFEFLSAIFDSYGNSPIHKKYRVQFYDENSGNITPNVHHVKLANITPIFIMKTVACILIAIKSFWTMPMRFVF